MAPRAAASRGAHRPRRRPVGVRPQRPLPRRPLYRALPRPVLDVRFTRRLPRLARSLTMALALWIEPHDGRHRGLPMGAYRAREAARLSAFGIRRHGARDARWRIDLLQQNGIDDSGRGLAYA